MPSPFESRAKEAAALYNAKYHKYPARITPAVRMGLAVISLLVFTPKPAVLVTHQPPSTAFSAALAVRIQKS